ncbi:hypothetical protein JZ751_025627 [Albula glossodonta]|uniref:Uncharacterized protein n=1 Tax=Albula glossodonta TaxID=121402 RepID=A0A8T2NE64_9TELE|nr:hypothetical protein JZ751_025627 [Albula glossodonta]
MYLTYPPAVAPFGKVQGTHASMLLAKHPALSGTEVCEFSGHEGSRYHTLTSLTHKTIPRLLSTPPPPPKPQRLMLTSLEVTCGTLLLGFAELELLRHPVGESCSDRQAEATVAIVSRGDSPGTAGHTPAEPPTVTDAQPPSLAEVRTPAPFITAPTMLRWAKSHAT